MSIQKNFKHTNLDDLVDIRSVEVTKNLPKQERIHDYINKIKNPYHFKYENYTVKLSFVTQGETLEEIVKNCIESHV